MMILLRLMFLFEIDMIEMKFLFSLYLQIYRTVEYWSTRSTTVIRPSQNFKIKQKSLPAGTVGWPRGSLMNSCLVTSILTNFIYPTDILNYHCAHSDRLFTKLRQSGEWQIYLQYHECLQYFERKIGRNGVVIITWKVNDNGLIFCHTSSRSASLDQSLKAFCPCESCWCVFAGYTS